MTHWIKPYGLSAVAFLLRSPFKTHFQPHFSIAQSVRRVGSCRVIPWAFAQFQVM